MARTALIHTLKAKAGMSEEDYRNFLSGWGVSSSRELTPLQEREVVDRLNKLAGQSGRRGGATGAKKAKSPKKKNEYTVEPYVSLKNRSSEWPTCDQLWMIRDGLWKDYSRMTKQESRDAALNQWLYRHFKIMQFESILREDVPKIVRALKAMVRQESQKTR